MSLIQEIHLFFLSFFIQFSALHDQVNGNQIDYSVAYSTDINAGNGHFNMRYISDHLSTGGWRSQECTKIYCGVGQSEPKIQDSGCDHNNIRPLCVIQNPISYTKVCPSKLEISHCGDNVKKVSIAVVYGQASSDTHFWNNPFGNANYNGNIIDAFSKVVAELKKDQENNVNVDETTNDFYQNYVPPSQYINCMGSLPCATKLVNGVSREVCDASGISDSKKFICKELGYIYPTTNEVYDSNPSNECQCTCPALSFNDPNALNSQPILASTQAYNSLRFEDRTGAEQEFRRRRGAESEFYRRRT